MASLSSRNATASRWSPIDPAAARKPPSAPVSGGTTAGALAGRPVLARGVASEARITQSCRVRSPSLIWRRRRCTPNGRLLQITGDSLSVTAPEVPRPRSRPRRRDISAEQVVTLGPENREQAGAFARQPRDGRRTGRRSRASRSRSGWKLSRQRDRNKPAWSRRIHADLHPGERPRPSGESRLSAWLRNRAKHLGEAGFDLPGMIEGIRCFPVERGAMPASRHGDAFTGQFHGVRTRVLPARDRLGEHLPRVGPEAARGPIPRTVPRPRGAAGAARRGGPSWAMASSAS